MPRRLFLACPEPAYLGGDLGLDEPVELVAPLGEGGADELVEHALECSTPAGRKEARSSPLRRCPRDAANARGRGGERVAPPRGHRDPHPAGGCGGPESRAVRDSNP
jgi:hypothetical protein